LLVGVEVVEDDVGLAAPRPLVLVAADAVEEIKDRILVVLGVPRRRVDLRLALDADRLRFVLDRLQLAAVNAVALDVKALGGRGKALSLVWLARLVLAVQAGAAQRQQDGTGFGQQCVSHGILSCTKSNA